MIERLVWVQEVAGLSPAAPTINGVYSVMVARKVVVLLERGQYPLDAQCEHDVMAAYRSPKPFVLVQVEMLVPT